MKLSQLSTKKALSKMLMLIPIVKEIINDKKLLSVWKRGYQVEPNSSALEIEVAKQKCATEKIFELLTLLIEEHEMAVYKILSIINDKTIQEVEEQPITETIAQLQELLNDQSFLQLFTTQKA